LSNHSLKLSLGISSFSEVFFPAISDSSYHQ
jgi:hypothetical protein